MKLVEKFVLNLNYDILLHLLSFQHNQYIKNKIFEKIFFEKK